MKTINNFKGFCLVTPVPIEPEPAEEHSVVVGKKRFNWAAQEPVTIYSTLQELIDATPGFNKKTHLVCEVIIHLVGERVEIVSV